MTSRDKFQAAVRFEADAPIMKTEFGYWAGTIRRWRTEGLPAEQQIPESVLDGDLVRGSVPFGFDTQELVDRNLMPRFRLDSYLVKFPIDFSPRLGAKTIFEDEHHRIFSDSYGLVQKVLKNSATPRQVIEYPIRNRDDFYSYRGLYDTDYASRLPDTIENLAAALKNRDYPIRLGGGPFGFSFFPRTLLGEVRYMTLLHDDPGLIHEFNEFFLGFAMEYWGLILENIDIDCIVILEDIAYRSGPMISPAMFEEFVIPYTKRLVDYAADFGVSSVVVDCDGYVEDLIPLWVDAGVNGLFPVEGANDILRIRKNYPDLLLFGGVDKRVVIKGDRSEIDRELIRIAGLFGKGGYVPHIDHAVSQDISWNNFAYYRERLNTLIDEHHAGGSRE